MKKRIELLIIIWLVSSFTILMINDNKVEGIDPYFSLVFKTNGGAERPDMGNFLRQHLARIGIDVEVIIQDWPTFVGELIAFRDFDICYVAISGSADPDTTGVYDENGSLNIWGYHTSMDWDDDKGTGLNEWYLREGTQIMPPNSQERIEHYWEWEQYLMDEICPMLPMFVPRTYQAHWSNLEGYNYTKGILQSWGNMSWEGTHKGQVSTDELVISTYAWVDIHPFFMHDNEDSFLESLAYDPLVWIDHDGSIWPHLAKRFDYIDDTTIEIEVREGIKWQSDPEGNFTNEFLDIYDVYFTLYMWRYVSSDQYLWKWVDGLEIIDDMTMRIYIDGDSSTSEPDSYAPSLRTLNKNIIPEHYLNQSQLGDGITPDTNHPAWQKLTKDCLGTGLFEFDSYIEGMDSNFKVNPNCWWANNSITNDPLLNWNERFGDFSASPENLRMRFLPGSVFAQREFIEGRVDLVPLSSSAIYLRDEYQLNTDFVILSNLVSAYTCFGFNMREVRPEMGDRTPSAIDPTMSKGLAMRKAICYAIDRDEINKIVYSGEYYITDYPLSPKYSVWCNPNIIQYNFDLDKAREYMAIAGYYLGYYHPPPIQSKSLQRGIIAMGVFTGFVAITGLVWSSVTIIRKIARRSNKIAKIKGEIGFEKL